MQSERVIVIISLKNVFDFLLVELGHITCLDDIQTVMHRLISCLIGNFKENNEKLYNEQIVGVMDYLEFLGVSSSSTTKLTHELELKLINTLFNIIPDLENDKAVEIIGYRIRDHDTLYLEIVNKHVNYTTH